MAPRNSFTALIFAGAFAAQPQTCTVTEEDSTTAGMEYREGDDSERIGTDIPIAHFLIDDPTQAVDLSSRWAPNLNRATPDEEAEGRLDLLGPATHHSNQTLPRDERFLLSYPWRPGNIPRSPNLRFYKNEIAFEPKGWRIDRFHTGAFGKYRFLEEHHGYILLKF